MTKLTIELEIYTLDCDVGYQRNINNLEFRPVYNKEKYPLA